MQPGSILSKLTEDVDEYFNGIEKVLAAVPKGDMFGEFPCPVCKTGMIKFVRSGARKHLHLGCTTPECVMLIQ